MADAALSRVAPPDALWRLLRPLLFQLDAERAHHLAIATMAAWSRVCRVADNSPAGLSRELWGLRFANPIGLAAGLDKNAQCIAAWQALGFGFVEVGTVTALAQPGNDRPRLFRLPADRALLNRMGFNNDGAVVVARRIAALRERGLVRVPLFVNIGKSKVVELKDAAADYGASFAAVADVADVVVVNVSSPNTPGLRDLQKSDELARILDAVLEKNRARMRPLPVLVKLAPDLADDDAHVLAAACIDAGVSGLVISNTTLVREGLIGPVPAGAGGISGAPLFTRATQMLQALTHAFGNKLVWVGVGGVFSVDDVVAKQQAGADLVQVYTGFIYQGPRFARQLVRGLAARAAS